MQPLNFKLSLNVPDSRLAASLVNLVYERLKRINDLLDKASILEIKLSQKDETTTPLFVAEIIITHAEGHTHETAESKEWETAFYNVLDKVADIIGTPVARPLTETVPL